MRRLLLLSQVIVCPVAFGLPVSSAFIPPMPCASRYVAHPLKGPSPLIDAGGLAGRRLGRPPAPAPPPRLSPQDVIEAGVSFDTFAPQFLWLLMIAAPDSALTKKTMGPLTPILGLAVVHLAIVLVAGAQEGALSQVLIFAEVFDPSKSQLAGMQKLFAYPNFVAEEWPHVLIWDLFVGRMVWLDGLARGIDTRVALAFCNFIGPPGLLIHAATCVATGKGLPPMGFAEEDKKG